MHASENALMAKVRAMYARRLTPEHYRAMLSCRSIGEVAAYLKEKTPYGPYMESASSASVHREWLEHRLRDAQYRQFELLAYYAYAIHAPIFDYFRLNREASRLAHSLAVVADRANSESPASSPFFARHSVIPWDAVDNAADLRSWLAALEGTPYHRLCLPFLNANTGTVDMPGLDHALEQYKTRQLLTMARTAYGGDESEALTDLLRLCTDMNNLAAIYRAGVLRRQDTAAFSAVVTGGGSLTDRQLKELIAARDNAAFRTALTHTRYRDVADWEREGYIELALDRYLYRVCRHRLRFTTFPSVAVLCYATLQQLELNNIIHIIEGVRYEAPDAAADTLVGADGFFPDGSNPAATI